MDSEKIDGNCMISVITVCYNEEQNIAKTIESVLRQNGTCFEYIVLDGLSVDKTFDIVCSYREQFVEKNLEYLVKSEKDMGIYNAMNKAVSLARGEWVVFMNAGDYFADNGILERAVNVLQRTSCDILYGDTYFVKDEVSVLRKCERYEQIKKSMIFYHQSSFSKRQLLVNNPFDEKYKICADYKFFLDCALKGKKFYYMEEPIAYFVYGGISTVTEFEDVVKEILLVRYEHGLINKWNYKIKIWILNIYGYGKKFIPAVAVRRLEGMLDKSRKELEK